MDMKRRLDWDFVKAFLMLIVIFGHVCPANSDTWTPITRVIGLFAMPLFFFVSGYFQSNISDAISLLVKYKKTIMRIVIPQMLWGSIYVLLSFVVLLLCRNQIASLKDLLIFFKYTPYYIAGFYWFFSALFLCVIVGSLISWLYFCCRMAGLMLLVISPFLFCLLPIDLYHFSFVYFYYTTGMLYNKYQIKLLSIKGLAYIDWLMLILTILVIWYGCQFYPIKSFYYTSNLFKDTPFFDIVYRYGLCGITSILALYWIMKMFKKYSDKKVFRWFAVSGRDTLFIYCSHMLILEFVYYPILWSVYDKASFPQAPCLFSYLWGFVVAISLYIVLIYVSRWLNKNKKIMMLFSGR